MKTLSDIVGRKQGAEGNIPSEEKSDLMMRKIEPSESLTEKLLSAQRKDSSDDKSGITDLLIRGLVERLPKPDSVWSLDDRAKWLRTAAGIFDLVYKRDDGEQTELSIVKQAAGNPLSRGLPVAETKQGASSGASRPL
jgi:hypothetical protein